MTDIHAAHNKSMNPAEGDRLLRLREVLERLSLGRTRWLEGVAEGYYPAPVRLAERTVRWRLSDIAALIDQGARPA